MKYQCQVGNVYGNIIRRWNKWKETKLIV
jgi:hypothetical protein